MWKININSKCTSWMSEFADSACTVLCKINLLAQNVVFHRFHCSAINHSLWLAVTDDCCWATQCLLVDSYTTKWMNNSSCLSVDCSTVNELLVYVHCTLGNDPSCSDLVMGWASGNVIAKKWHSICTIFAKATYRICKPHVQNFLIFLAHNSDIPMYSM